MLKHQTTTMRCFFCLLILCVNAHSAAAQLSIVNNYKKITTGVINNQITYQKLNKSEFQYNNIAITNNIDYEKNRGRVTFTYYKNNEINEAATDLINNNTPYATCSCLLFNDTITATIPITGIETVTTTITLSKNQYSTYVTLSNEAAAIYADSATKKLYNNITLPLTQHKLILNHKVKYQPNTQLTGYLVFSTPNYNTAATYNSCCSQDDYSKSLLQSNSITGKTFFTCTLRTKNVLL